MSQTKESVNMDELKKQMAEAEQASAQEFEQKYIALCKEYGLQYVPQVMIIGTQIKPGLVIVKANNE